MNSKDKTKFIFWRGESYTLDEFLNIFQKDMHKMVDEISGIPSKKPTVVKFRDWILGDRTYPTTDQTVSIRGDDFTILASYYRKFQTLLPYFQEWEAKAKAKIAEEQEKLQEDHRYIQANGLDSVAFSHLSLSYPQWKQRGRFVKQGEKSKVYTMDGTGTDYALFHFTQTDVAETRYKSPETKPSSVACASCAFKPSDGGCCLSIYAKTK